MLGVPVDDYQQLKAWSQDFAEMLGNFPAQCGNAHPRILASVLEMAAYFPFRPCESSVFDPRDGLVSSLMNAEIQGDRLSEEEVIANCIVDHGGGGKRPRNQPDRKTACSPCCGIPTNSKTLRCNFSLIPICCRGVVALRKPQPAILPGWLRKTPFWVEGRFASARR